MKNRKYGDLTVIMNDKALISETAERVKVFLNSYALYVDRWFDVTGDLLYDVICLLKEKDVYDMVNYQIAALKEIILYAIQRMDGIEDSDDLDRLKRFVSGVIDGYTDQRKDTDNVEISCCYEDFNSDIIDIVIRIDTFQLMENWYKGNFERNKYKVLLYAVIFSYLADAFSEYREDICMEQLCCSFFETQFALSVQQDAYQQYTGDFYKCVIRILEEKENEQ